MTIWYQKPDFWVLAVDAQTNEIVIRSKDRRKLHLVASKWSVVEHSVTRVDAVVAVVVHDYEVARQGILWLDDFAHASLTVYRVWKRDTELREDELHIT